MMAAPSTALVGFVLGACTLAAASDAVSRRVPNLIPLAILCGVALERAHEGWTSLGSAVGALALVLVIGTFAHARGWFGGGDVKLAAAVSAAFGLPACFAFLVLTGACGGVVALAVLLSTRRMTTAQALVTVDVLMRTRKVTLADKTATVPYAIAIAFGALLTTAFLHLSVLKLS
ncbi:MAG TPA: prepilin peptidase [Candidatus Elarobacter sp.]|jgi:prepilin peptidase CpaA|nr:prepilin peptidase [Candidatus Elarobacter sp.]